MTYRPYHRNYYHSLGEAIFAVHLLACTYFQYCQHGDGSDLTAVFIDTIDDPVDWDTSLQSANEALQCLTPRPAYTIKDPDLHERVGYLLLSASHPTVHVSMHRQSTLLEAYAMHVHLRDTTLTLVTNQEVVELLRYLSWLQSCHPSPSQACFTTSLAANLGTGFGLVILCSRSMCKCHCCGWRTCHGN